MNTELLATNMIREVRAKERRLAQLRFIQKQKDRTNEIMVSIQEKADDIYYDVQALVDECAYPMKLTKDEIKEEAYLAAFVWGASC